MLQAKLDRWVKRTGRIVRWGNIIMGYSGQELIEVFATEEQAVERQRQAEACEAIGDDREPVPVCRKRIR